MKSIYNPLRAVVGNLKALPVLKKSKLIRAGSRKSRPKN